MKIHFLKTNRRYTRTIKRLFSDVALLPIAVVGLIGILWLLAILFKSGSKNAGEPSVAARVTGVAGLGSGHDGDPSANVTMPNLSDSEASVVADTSPTGKLLTEAYRYFLAADPHTALAVLQADRSEDADPRITLATGVCKLFMGETGEATSTLGVVGRALPPRFHQPHLYESVGHLAEEKWSEAIDAANRCIQRCPDCRAGYLVDGFAKNENGDPMGAVLSFSHLIRIAPDESLGWTLRSVAYEQLGNGELANRDMKRAGALIATGQPSAANWIESGQEAPSLDPKVAVDRLMNITSIADWAEGFSQSVSRSERDATLASRVESPLTIKEALQIASNGDIALACAQLESRARVDATSNVLRTLGILQIDVQRHADSIRTLTRVLEANPDDAAAYVARGIAYAKLGNWDSVIADFSQAIRVEPGNPVAYANRAAAWASLGDHDKAIADYERAEQVAKPSTDILVEHAGLLIQKGDFRKANKLLTMPTVAQSDSPNALKYKAQIAMERQDISAAVEAIDHSLKLAPGQVDSWRIRIRIFKQSGDIVEALRSAEQLIASGKGDADDRFEFACLLHQTGRPADSLAVLNELIAVDRTRSEWLIRRGKVRTDLAELDSAVDDFSAAIRIDGKTADLLMRRSVNLLAMEKMTSQAILDLEAALEMGLPKSKESRLVLARAYLKQGSSEPALKHLKIATSEFPSDPRVWMTAGDAFEQSGDLAKAKVCFDRAAEKINEGNTASGLSADAALALAVQRRLESLRTDRLE
ncbi:tetratricopeptide repeat protein [Rubripirellula reticaptiva]|uniref:Cellulose synthase subunit BcsC n=1 Tax=Rubripirellula reticaptiva TaxID=2528013 RepID=A0A5C6EMB2_9BACT|nr:tetratricopeptide repeat protein [Rubripirellula reticaptiva]TWU48429.1 cellulose synthase subunit BcsC [Rubripirellula reticaptiva]